MNKKLGIISAIILSSSAFAFPLTATADELKISNQTAYALSFNVNGVCSSMFGSVDPYTIKMISEKDFYGACKSNFSPCQVKVFDTGACQGKLIALVEYYIPQRYVALHGYGEHNISMAVSSFNNLFFTEAMPGQKQVKK